MKFNPYPHGNVSKTLRPARRTVRRGDFRKGFYSDHYDARRSGVGLLLAERSV